MKKNLISTLVLASLMTASAAYAATSGNYSGTQTFSGQVTVPTAQNQWEWATGPAITLTTAKTSELTANGTVLTQAATANTLLLAGQTKTVSIGSTTVTMRPKIELQNADNTAVTIDFSGATANNGKGVLRLKVTDDAGTKNLGEITLNVKAAGVGFYGETTATNPVVKNYPLLSNTTQTNSILQAALPASATAAMTTSAAETWLSALGVTQTASKLLGNYNQNLARTAVATAGAADAQEADKSDVYYGATYGLGVAQGDNYVVTFSNPVTTNTKWKSALKINLTYM
ncbi:hypothetical protein NLN92_23535 [Citrobacter portucalensis]|uniref:F4 family fimbrial subunit n=1 Tax=Citrobacter portucalensis TaxID=1639133 RepID=UPI00226B0F1C|nr:hypothetical protein [Citrobacter portucalensis]MCX8980967.1 hypothetical protein [Citrobacter portucalensis]